MNNLEKTKTIIKMINDLAIYYGKPRLPSESMRVYLKTLEGLDLPVIQQALNDHVTDPDQGRWMPTVAHIADKLIAQRPKPLAVIAEARKPTTPFGVLARMHIGNWDLNHNDDFYLRSRAEEVIARFDDWRARAVRGDYNDHEISIMSRYSIDPCAPFYDGRSIAPVDVRAKLSIRVEQRLKSEQHSRLLAPNAPEPTDEPPVLNKELAAKLVQMFESRA